MVLFSFSIWEESFEHNSEAQGAGCKAQGQMISDFGLRISNLKTKDSGCMMQDPRNLSPCIVDLASWIPGLSSWLLEFWILLNWISSLQRLCQQGGNLTWQISEFLFPLITNTYDYGWEWILELPLTECCEPVNEEGKALSINGNEIPTFGIQVHCRYRI